MSLKSLSVLPVLLQVPAVGMGQERSGVKGTRSWFPPWLLLEPDRTGIVLFLSCFGLILLFPTVEPVVSNVGLPPALFLGAVGLCPWTVFSIPVTGPVPAETEQNQFRRRGQDQPRDSAGSSSVPNPCGAGVIPVGKVKIRAAFSGVTGDAAALVPELGMPQPSFPACFP